MVSPSIDRASPDPKADVAARPRLTDLYVDSLERSEVARTAAEYAAFHAGTSAERKSDYARMVNDYYDLTTDFYEYGWGQSFHFAPRHRGESFEASIVRHEHFVAARLGLRPSMNVLDLGCGVGGPMRSIARFAGSSIVGVNNNEYQIRRGTSHNAKAGMGERCRFVKADFMQLPFEAASFDAAYAIEATCHAPDKVALFREVARVMRPGASFVGYEWALTDRYDGARKDHRAIKSAIEEGNGLPDIWPAEAVAEALGGAGFEDIECRDLAVDPGCELPWYLPLVRDWTLSGFNRTPAGRWVTNKMVRALEWANVAPRGARVVSDFLNRGADALVAGGEKGIFTPMLFFHGRLPV